MSLPPADLSYLNERGTTFSVVSEGNMTCVVFPAFPIPPGYDQTSSDLLVRLSPGYPDIPPDMWWFNPPVRLPDGAAVQATDSVEQYLGRAWQRWSRHFAPGQWRSGADCLESFLALIRRELQRCSGTPAR